jgi:hypothetical protein
MKKTLHGVPFNWIKDKKTTARYGPIHDMVTDVLARHEPEMYANLVEELRAEWNPVGAEVRLVEVMAELSCRLRGCLYLDTELLTQGMEASAAPDVPSDMALARACQRDFEGPKLLEKLSRYESRLSGDLSSCARLLRLSAKSRKDAEHRMAEALLRHKPCTSVIQ